MVYPCAVQSIHRATPLPGITAPLRPLHSTLPRCSTGIVMVEPEGAPCVTTVSLASDVRGGRSLGRGRTDKAWQQRELATKCLIYEQTLKWERTPKKYGHRTGTRGRYNPTLKY